MFSDVSRHIFVGMAILNGPCKFGVHLVNFGPSFLVNLGLDVRNWGRAKSQFLSCKCISTTLPPPWSLALGNSVISIWLGLSVLNKEMGEKGGGRILNLTCQPDVGQVQA